MVRLDIGHGGPTGLREADFGAEQEGAEQQISKRKDHVEIPVWVAVMQEVVSIEPEEEGSSFDVALCRHMHAPVQIFVGAIIEKCGQKSSADERSSAREARQDYEGHLGAGNQRRTIPPGHGHGLGILRADQVIGEVGFEYFMMDQSVARKWV